MENVQQAIRQDFTASIAAFEQDNFSEMNMYANRLMANAIFVDNPEYFLPGFFLKDVSGIFLHMKAMSRSVPLSTAKAVGSNYLISLKEYALGDRVNLEACWASFYQFYRDMRKFLTVDIENKVYSDNTAFTRHSFSWLLRYMKGDKQILLDPNNLLFKGVLNEFERIFRNHSGDLNDLLAICMVKALDRVYGYLTVTRISDGKIDARRLEESIYPYFDKIEELVYPKEKLQLSEVTKALWELTKKWRELFIEYMEVERVKPAEVERAIELPPEMRKKLTESISKTFEKEVKSE